MIPCREFILQSSWYFLNHLNAPNMIFVEPFEIAPIFEVDPLIIIRNLRDCCSSQLFSILVFDLGRKASRLIFVVLKFRLRGDYIKQRQGKALELVLIWTDEKCWLEIVSEYHSFSWLPYSLFILSQISLIELSPIFEHKWTLASCYALFRSHIFIRRR